MCGIEKRKLKEMRVTVNCEGSSKTIEKYEGRGTYPLSHYRSCQPDSCPKVIPCARFHLLRERTCLDRMVSK
jgi:hypothetical protein